MMHRRRVRSCAQSQLDWIGCRSCEHRSSFRCQGKKDNGAPGRTACAASAHTCGLQRWRKPRRCTHQSPAYWFGARIAVSSAHGTVVVELGWDGRRATLCPRRRTASSSGTGGAVWGRTGTQLVRQFLPSVSASIHMLTSVTCPTRTGTGPTHLLVRPSSAAHHVHPPRTRRACPHGGQCHGPGRLPCWHRPALQGHPRGAHICAGSVVPVSILALVITDPSI